ncbi:LOW QUALITY PROTEIN: hypothetical protein CRUP_019635 [Coryphaenoides rupestris]|nr:LOW QUALITY PROTEIN: hypothetical protein CRUP_019635 [Coryphaenoides rupestris]
MSHSCSTTISTYIRISATTAVTSRWATKNPPSANTCSSTSFSTMACCLYRDRKRVRWKRQRYVPESLAVADEDGSDLDVGVLGPPPGHAAVEARVEGSRCRLSCPWGLKNQSTTASAGTSSLFLQEMHPSRNPFPSTASVRESTSAQPPQHPDTEGEQEEVEEEVEVEVEMEEERRRSTSVTRRRLNFPDTGIRLDLEPELRTPTPETSEGGQRTQTERVLAQRMVQSSRDKSSSLGLKAS